MSSSSDSLTDCDAAFGAPPRAACAGGAALAGAAVAEAAVAGAAAGLCKETLGALATVPRSCEAPA